MGPEADKAKVCDRREIESLTDRATSVLSDVLNVSARLAEFRSRVIGENECVEAAKEVPEPVRAQIPELSHVLSRIECEVQRLHEQCGSLERL